MGLNLVKKKKSNKYENPKTDKDSNQIYNFNEQNIIIQYILLFY